jgi:hypothetical protein
MLSFAIGWISCNYLPFMSLLKKTTAIMAMVALPTGSN